MSETAMASGANRPFTPSHTRARNWWCVVVCERKIAVVHVQPRWWAVACGVVLWTGGWLIVLVES